ncbi:FtsX-like permease family protein [Pseudobutyrivibrio sp.]|uniref:FtsX-like permease family protein n=1 Tax=Pseudobutyrivibrio sp. TaxID=2014367 RepID=UPI00386BCDAA
MMKSNIRQYRLFVLCNTVLVMVCYFFGGIYFNNMFTSDRYVNSMISSNIITPTVVVFAFAVFFIPYTHFSFNLQNERKYGIMEATGVSWRDLWKFVLMENAFLAGCSLILGLASGIMLLTLFFKVFVKIIGIEFNFPAISINSVLRPSFALLIIYILTVIAIVIRLSRITVKEMIEDSKKVRIGKSSSIVLLLTGLTAICYSIIGVFFIFDQTNTNRLIVYYVVMLIGIYLMISNSYVLMIWLKKHRPNMFYKNLPVIGSIRQNFSMNKRIIFFSICLISFVVFFQTFSVYCSKLMVRNALNDNPFHIAYIEYEDGEYPSEKDLIAYAEKAGAVIDKNAAIPTILDGCFIISQNVANGNLGTDCNIEDGECVVYTQYDLHDGYPHDEFSRDKLMVNGSDELSVKEVNYSSLINNGLTPQNIIIVSEDEFDGIIQRDASVRTAVIRVINCETVSQSEALYHEIAKDYDMGLDGLFVSTQFIDMKTSDQSGKFLILVSTVMNMLLLFLNVVMIFFKVQSNRERNEREYALLWKLGINDAEIDKTRKTETAIVFIIPSFVAVCIGAIMTIGLIKISF